MSKGRPKVVVRLELSLMEEVREAVEKRNSGHVSTQHWDVSEYVRCAIRDKLKHDQRSRRRRKAAAAVPDHVKMEVENAFLELERVCPQVLCDALDKELDAIERAIVTNEYDAELANHEPSQPSVMKREWLEESMF